MRPSHIRAVLICFASCAALAQTTPSTPTFEVASVKPAAPPVRGGRGGGGRGSPGQANYTNTTMRLLLMNAYGVKTYQVSGPNWIDAERFDIVAKVPPGASSEDRKLMLQNLLAERFKLTLHRETKELPMYDLVVAKNGPKLKESAEVAPPANNGDAARPPLPSPAERKMGPDGFPIVPAGAGRSLDIMMSPGRMRMKVTLETMAQFADFLANQLDRPVMDKTGLTRKYDFNLEYAPEGVTGPFGMPVPPLPPPPPGGAAPAVESDSPGAPVLFTALQDQLGLKLEQKKGPVELLIIDHVEKIPTEN